MHKKEYNLQYSRCQYYCHNIWDYLDDKQLSVTTVQQIEHFSTLCYQIEVCTSGEKNIFKKFISKEKESSVKVFKPLLFLNLSTNNYF